MKIVQLTKKECKVWLNSPFNPPIITAEYSEDNFRDEFYDHLSLLLETLKKYGIPSEGDEGDFFLNDAWSLSRSFGVALLTKRMLRLGVLEDIQRVLAAFSDEYMVLVGPDMEGVSPMDVFVVPDMVYVYCEATSLETVFGNR